MQPISDSPRWLIVALLAASSALPATAAAQALPDLGQMAIEDLMRLDVRQVFGVAERLQPVTEVPSSVTIVTADDIRRYGYTTLADVLRSVRGFYVTDDRNYNYVGTRGFNRPGDYSTRVLLLVNGQRVNDNTYDQAMIGPGFAVDAAMFERVEVIRGPASSLYGTNALFAIVNVVTRTGASLDGASLDVDVGALGTRLARASAGHRFANGMDVALAGTYERNDGVRRLSFPAYDAPGTNHGIAEDLDGGHSAQAYGRFSADNLTVTGTFGRSVKDVPTASYFTLFNAQDPREQTKDWRGSLSALYARPVGEARVTAAVTYDHAGYEGVYPYAGDEPQDPTLVFFDGFEGVRWTASGRVTRPLPRGQTLTLGGEFVDNIDQNQWGGYEGTTDDSFVIDHSSRQGAAFVQHEIRPWSWLLLSGGLRHDRHPRFNRTTPRGAVIVMPSADHSFKYLYGKAFRAPNAYELYYYRDASAFLQPESIGTHEWTWEAYFGEQARTAVSAYRYRASRLLDLQLVDDDALDGLGFENAGETRAAGFELEGEIRVGRVAQALASYALQKAEDAGPGGRHLTNSPRHVTKLRLSVDGPLDRSFASFEWQHLSSRTTVAGTVVDPASVANVTVGLPIARAVTLTAHARNLFNARYADPASTEHLVDAIEQNGRTWRAGVRWTFWSPR